jgi:hypothetical protein
MICCELLWRAYPAFFALFAFSDGKPDSTPASAGAGIFLKMLPNQAPRPLCSASALRDVSGRAPRCPITSAAASAPSRAAVR